METHGLRIKQQPKVNDIIGALIMKTQPRIERWETVKMINNNHY